MVTIDLSNIETSKELKAKLATVFDYDEGTVYEMKIGDMIKEIEKVSDFHFQILFHDELFEDYDGIIEYSLTFLNENRYSIFPFLLRTFEYDVEDFISKVLDDIAYIKSENEKNKLHNFPVKLNDKTYWISRSVAVAGFIFKKLGDDWFVLANKRGKGCPDFQGYWNCPCGYLEYDRTCIEQMVAECIEECGFKSNKDKWKFVGYNDSPDENKQNVTMRYVYICDNDEDFNLALKKGGEKNEVDDVRWINLNKLNSYQFAFGHKQLIISLALSYILDIKDISRLILSNYVEEKENKE